MMQFTKCVVRGDEITHTHSLGIPPHLKQALGLCFSGPLKHMGDRLHLHSKVYRPKGARRACGMQRCSGLVCPSGLQWWRGGGGGWGGGGVGRDCGASWCVRPPYKQTSYLAQVGAPSVSRESVRTFSCVLLRSGFCAGECSRKCGNVKSLSCTLDVSKTLNAHIQ